MLGAGGTMGSAIARNLMRAGMGVRAWDRTREKAEPLADEGAEIFDSPAEAAQSASLLLTMLSDGDAVLSAMDGERGALAATSESALWLQMSTIGEAATARCAELATQHEIVFVDAPVLGTRQPAEEGKLVVMASGPDDEDVRERCRPVFDALGHKTLWVGPAGAGTRLKLVTNAWLLAVVEGCAESVALAEGLDLDPGLLLEAVAGGPLDLPYMRIKAKAILTGNFEPSFRLALAAKDASLIEDAAQARDLQLPLLATVHERLQESAREHGDEDVIAVYRTIAPDAVRARSR
ncbi:MAG: 6-phosphogluconate dehydrogenase, NAD-binding protein [Solirubrobacterales bacterium]|nr:6-phosphogluconate dehydrogenase, NAD-binding protein [Solirubrobacterales bacterium]